jgi:Uma2 family endonuclease
MARNSALKGVVSMEDLLERLGGISPARVRLKPLPGLATEKHLLALNERKTSLYELVDGVLVEKVLGLLEGGLAAELVQLLGRFLHGKDLGALIGSNGPYRLMRGLVRLPDISFASWDKFPGGMLPVEPIPDLAPDLAIEILSAGNTRKEMNRKVREYFLAGTQLVWLVDPAKRTVSVYTAPDQSETLDEGDVLGGGDVLPGLQLPVRDIFARVPKDLAQKRRQAKRLRKKD